MDKKLVRGFQFSLSVVISPDFIDILAFIRAFVRRHTHLQLLITTTRVESGRLTLYLWQDTTSCRRNAWGAPHGMHQINTQLLASEDGLDLEDLDQRHIESFEPYLVDPEIRSCLSLPNSPVNIDGTIAKSTQ